MFANRHLFLEKNIRLKEKETSEPEHRQPVNGTAIPILQERENGRTPLRPVRAKLPEVEIQWLG